MLTNKEHQMGTNVFATVPMGLVPSHGQASGECMDRAEYWYSDFCFKSPLETVMNTT